MNLPFPPDPLVVAGRTLRSRLIVGTGKYTSMEIMRQAIDASGASAVTVAIRRLELPRDGDTQGGGGPGEGPRTTQGNLLDHLDRERLHILPNTAGCFRAEDAVRVAHLSRELGLGDWVKLEVLGDPRTLLPDPVGTLEATRELVRSGFTVLAYTSDDPVMALRLEDAGAASVMPAGSPIGSGLGVLNPHHIALIIESLRVPVIVDAGVGTASDVTLAMELGAEAVLLNSGIALAQDPVHMAHAMRLALEAGYWAQRSGRIPRRRVGAPSSPTAGVIGE